MRELGIGLVGYGYWGTKLARNVQEAEGCRLAAVCDDQPQRLAAAAQRHPESAPVRSLEQLLAASDVEAVVLATPASLHAAHVRAALAAGKHVLVEKPLALSVADCDELCALADETGLALMVGHTFLYSEPVRLVRDLVASGALGKVLYVHSQRLNLGVIRQDLNTLWNFGPHDVSILLHLLDELPARVSARQFSLLSRRLEDVAFAVLEFPSGIVAHVHESWLDPRKIRLLTVVGDEKMVVYDDTDVDLPVRIFDNGVIRPAPGGPGGTLDPALVPGGGEGFGEFKLELRTGDMLAPRVSAREPLRTEIEHFASCALNGTRPLTDARHGRAVVAVLEALDRSAAAGGVAVEVEPSVAATA